MKKQNVIGTMFSVICATSIAVSGCGLSENISLEDIVSKATEKNTVITSSYTETESVSTENGKTVDKTLTKMWTAGNKERIEQNHQNGSVNISVNDGQKVVMFTKGDKMAVTWDAPKQNPPALITPEKAMAMKLDRMRSTHELSIAGKETINGKVTYHIVAKVKDAKTLPGNEDMWVDERSWYPVRVRTEIGNKVQDTTWVKSEINPKIDAAIFTLELPQGVELRKQ